MIPSANAARPTVPHAEGTRKAAGGRRTPLVLWAIVALAAALRLIGLGAKSFWLDEIASVVIARMPGNSFWGWLWHDEGNMALYYVMLRPWLHIHLGEATVRLLSVVPGIASIPVIYLLGMRLFGRSVGLLAALFLALSTCSVVYSQEARGYSWLLLDRAADVCAGVRLRAHRRIYVLLSLFRIIGSAGARRVAGGSAQGAPPLETPAGRQRNPHCARSSRTVDDPHPADRAPRLGAEAVVA
jgi:predicted membrane-bound mannosyltransferase